ncbi:hypothetical protein RYA05_05800 [Pseudomonas syringae pv. actinidiae]|nr:hypothetical protein [Pseudomonas syringae pv. actinidiae]
MKMLYSFPLPYPESNAAVVHRVRTHPFVRTGALLSVKNQHGGLKLYGVVDKHLEMVEELILVVGTGQEVPSQLIDRLVMIDSVLLCDNKFGYSVYYVAPEIVTCEFNGAPLKTVVINVNYDDPDIEDFFSVIQSFADRSKSAVSVNVEAAKEYLETLTIKIFKSGFEKSDEYKEFLSFIHGSDLVESLKFR